MPIEQKTPARDVARYLRDRLEEREKKLLAILSYAGEAGLRAARLFGTYTDRTGNLRSSTGYAVAVDGRIADLGGFGQVPPKAASPGDRHDGARQGERFARELARGFPAGAALVVVAGMDYAGHVSAKGYDVLDSSEEEARRELLRLLEQHGFIAE